MDILYIRFLYTVQQLSLVLFAVQLQKNFHISAENLPAALHEHKKIPPYRIVTVRQRGTNIKTSNYLFYYSSSVRIL